MKRVLFIFVLAFLLNLGWEHAHAYLYAGYRGGVITDFILMRASLGDAIIITLLLLPFLSIPYMRRKSWMIVPLGIAIAVGIEWYALHTGRWAYNSHMPIIPVLSVGLTPAIQLGILGYLAYRCSAQKSPGNTSWGH